MDYLAVLAGIALLLWGGDLIVGTAVRFARRVGVSPLATGIIVVGLGTSAPELLTSVDAALQGSPAIAIGNVVGSNIANILLVLGLSALVLPLRCDPDSMRRDLLCLGGASALVLLSFQQSIIERWMGCALALALVAYLAALLITSRRAEAAGAVNETERSERYGVAYDSLLAVVSIAMLVLGAHWLVTGALGIARSHGVPEHVIGLSLVAVGTSLPELAAAGMAVVRRQMDVAVGNIVGSTLFNMLGILGITALVTPLEVPDAVANFDLWVMLAAIAALALFARSGWRISRIEGGALLLGYPVYLSMLFVR